MRSAMSMITVPAGRAVQVTVPAWPAGASGFQVYRTAVLTQTTYSSPVGVLSHGWVSNGTTYRDDGSAGS